MLEQPIMASRDHDQDPAPAIVTLGLTRRFGQLTAVRDLSLQVPRGSVYGFLGLNGAGKSTTIRMLLGLLRPTSGEVALLGSAMPGDRLSALGRIGAPVESPTVYPHLTGVENLEATRRLLGVGRQEMARASVSSTRGRSRLRSRTWPDRWSSGGALAVRRLTSSSSCRSPWQGSYSSPASVCGGFRSEMSCNPSR